MSLLKLITNEADEAELSTAEKLYRDKIEPMIVEICQPPSVGHGRQLAFDEESVTSDPKVAQDILKLLGEKAVKTIVVGHRQKLPESEDVLVIFYDKPQRELHDETQQNWHAAVVRNGTFPSRKKKDYLGQTAYVLKAEDFIRANDRDAYRDTVFYLVRETLALKHGETSQEVRDIDRVIELTRSIIYDGPESELRTQALTELRKLILSVGAAARAVIADFERDFEENEGWA